MKLIDRNKPTKDEYNSPDYWKNSRKRHQRHDFMLKHTGLSRDFPHDPDDVYRKIGYIGTGHKDNDREFIDGIYDENIFFVEILNENYVDIYLKNKYPLKYERVGDDNVIKNNQPFYINEENCTLTRRHLGQPDRNRPLWHQFNPNGFNLTVNNVYHAHAKWVWYCMPRPNRPYFKRQNARKKLIIKLSELTGFNLELSNSLLWKTLYIDSQMTWSPIGYEDDPKRHKSDLHLLLIDAEISKEHWVEINKIVVAAKDNEMR